MFLHEGDEEHSTCRGGAEGMSLLDKVTMWQQKATEDNSVIENDDLYQGVKDDVEEIIDEVNLQLYRNTIFNSAAYEWLLANLERESYLQWNATQPLVMTGSIRSRILDMLPTGTISKRRPPTVYEVKFDFSWGTGIKTELGRELRDRLDISGWSLEKFLNLFDGLVSVTGSPEEAQLLSIRDYMRQTWPLSRLLHVLRTGSDCDECRNSSKQSSFNGTDNAQAYGDIVQTRDKTQLEAQIDDSRLIVLATGPAHFIAECGEQLAWLRCALLSSSPHFIVHCTPSITVYSIDSVSASTNERLKFKGYCRIGFDVSYSAVRTSTMPAVPNSWQSLDDLPVLILGYPISRRPEACPGLELRFHELLSISQAESATTVNGKILLEGPGRQLQLMRHCENVFLWHPLEDGLCSCFVRYQVDINGIEAPSGFTNPSLNAGRHILTSCQDHPHSEATSHNP